MAQLRLLAFLCCLSVLCGLTAAADLCGSDPVGTAISLSAICYPNGSVVITWSSTGTALVRRRHIEYQCFTDTGPQPDPEVVLPWSSIPNGSRSFDNILNENTTCTFSGCYQTAFFTNHQIQAMNCTLPVIPTSTFLLPMTTSVESSTAFLIPTPPTGLHFTSPPPMATSSTAASVTPTAADSNRVQSTDGMPGSSPFRIDTGVVIAIAVCASAVVLGIVVCIGLIIYCIIYRKKLERKFDNGPYKEKVDLDFYPVSIAPHAATSIESITTVLDYLYARVPAIITDLKLVSEKSGALLEEDGDHRSISTQPAEDTDCTIHMQLAEDTDARVPAVTTPGAVSKKDGVQPEEDEEDYWSIRMQPTEDSDAGVATMTAAGVVSKEDGVQPEEDEEDDYSIHLEHTEDLDQELSTPVISTQEREVVKPQGTVHDVNPRQNRGYIPLEQVLSPATSSASNEKQWPSSC